MVRYYVEKWADLKNQTLKKSAGTQNCYAQRNNPGICNITIALKWGGGGGGTLSGSYFKPGYILTSTKNASLIDFKAMINKMKSHVLLLYVEVGRCWKMTLI